MQCKSQTTLLICPKNYSTGLSKCSTRKHVQYALVLLQREARRNWLFVTPPFLALQEGWDGSRRVGSVCACTCIMIALIHELRFVSGRTAVVLFNGGAQVVVRSSIGPPWPMQRKHPSPFHCCCRRAQPTNAPSLLSTLGCADLRPCIQG